MTSYRIVQLSDTHISADNPGSVANLRSALGEVRANLPDAMVVTGDIIYIDPDIEADHRLAVEELDLVRMREVGVVTGVLPGNHDVGESGIVPWEGPPVTTERLQRFTDYWGSDRFSFYLGPWQIIGMNCMIDPLLFPAEAAAHARWMAAELTEHDGPIGVFTHKPFVLHGDNPPAPQGLVEDLSELISAVESNVRFVSSGHLHRSTQQGPDDRSAWARIWCPSTHFSGRDDFSCDADRRSGYAEFTLHDDGLFDVEFRSRGVAVAQ